MIADKSTRLLTATVACLAEFGFQVPTATLATRAGLSPGTLFRIYPTKEALLAATYPYVLAQLTPALAAQAPRPGEPLRAWLARWWDGATQAALAEPASFTCWRLWRGVATGVVAEQVYGPFAGVRPPLAQALQERTGSGLLLPPAAVVPSLAAQWLVAVELALQPAAAGLPGLPPDPWLPLRALFARWWASTGLLDTWPAVPDPVAQARRDRLQAVVQQYVAFPLPASEGF